MRPWTMVADRLISVSVSSTPIETDLVLVVLRGLTLKGD